jgi:hypothetical protein
LKVKLYKKCSDNITSIFENFHVILLLLTTIKDGAGDKYMDRPLVAAPAPGPARLQKKTIF